MITLKRVGFLFLAGTIWLGGIEFGESPGRFEPGERSLNPGIRGLVPTAEARVGRPLTPVSVAGVARRTVRRCAVGVYNCSLSEPGSVDSLLGQINVEPIRFPG